MVPQNPEDQRPYRQIQKQKSPRDPLPLFTKSQLVAFLSRLTVGYAHEWIAAFEAATDALIDSPSPRLRKAALKLSREVMAKCENERSKEEIKRIFIAMESGGQALEDAEYTLLRASELLFDYFPIYEAASRRHHRRLNRVDRKPKRAEIPEKRSKP
jgi:hypothetical protein